MKSVKVIKIFGIIGMIVGLIVGVGGGFPLLLLTILAGGWIGIGLPHFWEIFSDDFEESFGCWYMLLFPLVLASMNNA